LILYNAGPHQPTFLLEDGQRDTATLRSREAALIALILKALRIGPERLPGMPQTVQAGRRTSSKVLLGLP
jgi:hypothetical protein